MEFDRIGFASGSYYSKFAEQILTFAKINLPVQKDVFFICTAGNPMDLYFNSIAKIAEAKHCSELGRYYWSRLSRKIWAQNKVPGFYALHLVLKLSSYLYLCFLLTYCNCFLIVKNWFSTITKIQRKHYIS